MSYLWRILTAMRMTIKEFFSFKTNKFFWVNIIAMIVVVVVMIFGVLKWLDIHTHHGETVAVPDVKGMTVDEAAKMFRNHGLVYVISDTKYVKDKAAGIILELKPGVGEKVKEGRTVYLTVNTLDVPLRAIPDVADNSSLPSLRNPVKVFVNKFKDGIFQPDRENIKKAEEQSSPACNIMY